MDEEFEIRWDVKNVDLLWQEKVSLISPIFDECEIFHPHRRRLIITPTVEPDTTNGYMSIYLKNIFSPNCHGTGRASILNMTFSLIHPIQGKVYSKSAIQWLCSRIFFGFERFISVEKLKEYCLDEFVIQCEFKKVKQDFTSFAHFFDQKSCSDVNLIVGDDKIVFPAHKLVLALGSSYFQTEFAMEKSLSRIKMRNMKPHVVIEMLRCLYTGEAINTEQLMYDLFEAAMFYHVHLLRSKCLKFLLMNLQLENVVRTLMTCRGYFSSRNQYSKELIFACMSLIDQCLDKVMRLNLFQELLEKEPELLTEIVAHLSINQPVSRVLKKTCIEEESLAFSQTFKNMFERFAQNSDFSDIVIQVSDSKYPAHKVILAARSPVFNRMFSHNMKETISGVVTIEDIRPQVFEKLLRFMYSNEIEREDDLVQEILVASDKYEINDLKWQCEKILEEKLTPENVTTTLIFAADHNAERLKKKCLGFITRADSPFWSNSSDNFEIPISILNDHLAKSHPYLLYEMLQQIHQNKLC